MISTQPALAHECKLKLAERGLVPWDPSTLDMEAILWGVKLPPWPHSLNASSPRGSPVFPGAGP